MSFRIDLQATTTTNDKKTTTTMFFLISFCRLRPTIAGSLASVRFWDACWGRAGRPPEAGGALDAPRGPR